MGPKKHGNKRQKDLQLEQHLQQVVFARETDVIQSLGHNEEPVDQEKRDDAAVVFGTSSKSSVYADLGHDFWKKRHNEEIGSDESENEDFEDGNAILKPTSKDRDGGDGTAAWTDSDDEITAGQGLQNAVQMPKGVAADQQLKSYQERKFTSLYKRPKWADGVRAADDSDDEDGDSLSKVAGKLIRKSTHLSRGTLLFNKCAPLNADLSRSHGYYSLQFHPKYEIGMVASRKSIDFFKMEGRDKQSENRTIKSYDFPESHMERIRVTPDGREVIIGTIHSVSSTHSIDLESGKTQTFSLMRGRESVGLRGMSLSADGSLIACRCENGRILIMDAKVKEFIKSMKMNDDVKCVCFTADSQQLFSHGTSGQVYIWDVKEERLVHKFYDEGAVTGTALSASPNGQFLATGSESGVVNLYDLKTCIREETPKPLKSLMNLTTEITGISFNHSSEVFSFHSRLKHNAVRLAHVPSRSVYSNFPNQEDFYGRVSEIAFSPTSGFAAMATNQKSVSLFRLCHFSRY